MYFRIQFIPRKKGEGKGREEYNSFPEKKGPHWKYPNIQMMNPTKMRNLINKLEGGNLISENTIVCQNLDWILREGKAQKFGVLQAGYKRYIFCFYVHHTHCIRWWIGDMCIIGDAY